MTQKRSFQKRKGKEKKKREEAKIFPTPKN